MDLPIFVIKKLYRSKSDIENLSRLRTSIPNGIDSFDYRKVIVTKPWGYEYLMYDNPHAAIWILHLKQNHKTSMHCHPNKKTSLIVLSGRVTCSTLEGWLERGAGEGVVIDEAVFHSTKATSRGGALVMEVESPSNKKELVRLNDEYGREHQGYEGPGNMTRELKGYEYIDFHDFDNKKRVTKKVHDAELTLCYHDKSIDIYEAVQQEKGRLFCILQGHLHDQDGNIVLSTGETMPVERLKLLSRIYAFSDIIYLTISHYGKKG